LAKVQRRVVKKGRRRGLSTEQILLIVGGTIIVVVVLAYLLWPKPKVVVAGDPQGLAVCGSVPCPAKGDPNAPVKMVDVSSFTCSHCRDYSLTIEPKIDEQYIKTGKVYYIAHPLGFDSLAQQLAAAALCANDQGKYWEYSAALFQNQSQLDPSSLSSYAQQVGLDTQAFAACVNSGKHTKDASDSSNSAMSVGVDATPSFFLNGKLAVRGALPFSCTPGTPECSAGDFQSRIEEALKGSK
jgi:protein-disulfide isomerase